MTRSADHLGDELLSAFVDDQVTQDEREQVQAHLRSCSACQQRHQELRAVVDLLRGLPEVPVPRDFKLGPRVVADPPNVVRLRRWYIATRVAAGSLAAGFVLLSAGVLYVDSRPSAAATTSAVSKPQVALAPTAGQRTDSARAPTIAPAAPKAAAPALAPQASPGSATGAAAAQPAAPAAQSAAQAGQPADQVAATTSVSPLPTPVPTPAPTAVPLLPAPAAVASTDEAAPLRLAAIAVGLLAVLALVTTVAVRHRLRRAVFHL